MQVTVQKWGNSLALRIPKAVAMQVNIHKGSRVDMALVANKIILDTTCIKEYHLGSLLKKVNKMNLHKEISFGMPYNPQDNTR